MNQIVVGISDLKVSGNAGDILITYALGSCVGVAVYDPVGKVGGLLHFMLPDSSIDETKAKRNPAMFADTGIPLLFKSWVLSTFLCECLIGQFFEEWQVVIHFSYWV
jgi:chemotaxis protein CheD